MRQRLLPAALALALLTQCHKGDPDPTPVVPDPLSQLPSPTQTGQRTFGCLVNGQAWIPAGNPFAGPLFTAHYLGGNLYLTANRSVVVANTTRSQRIQIEIDSINTTGTYVLTNASSRLAEFSDHESSCLHVTDATHPATVIITKLDVVNRIVSGTFAFTLETPSCGKVVVTNGRFDSLY